MNYNYISSDPDHNINNPAFSVGEELFVRGHYKGYGGRKVTVISIKETYNDRYLHDDFKYKVQFLDNGEIAKFSQFDLSTEREVDLNPSVPIIQGV